MKDEIKRNVKNVEMKIVIFKSFVIQKADFRLPGHSIILYYKYYYYIFIIPIFRVS